ncbi:MAG: hypothetical protein QXH60_01555 [Candidatus Pacearchaeota archaeon]
MIFGEDRGNQERLERYFKARMRFYFELILKANSVGEIEEAGRKAIKWYIDFRDWLCDSSRKSVFYNFLEYDGESKYRRDIA